ncbi:hypothetical protein GC176_07715 [bacterium]|nr:hypothetical protein [bacterium]
MMDWKLRRSISIAGLSSVLTVISFLQAAAGDEILRVAADRQIDVQHIRLELDVDLVDRSVSGTATIDYRPLKSFTAEIALDAVGLEVLDTQAGIVSNVNATLHPVAFETSDSQLRLIDQRSVDVDTAPRPFAAAGQTGRLQIRYRVRNPHAGLYFFGPTDSAPNVPLTVWSQGEPRGSRYWFPCLDQPNERQTTELIVTAPAGFEVLSNGTLTSREAVRGSGPQRTRFHWKQDKPHATYLTSLVVGDFAVERDEWRGRPVSYYVPKDRAADLRRTFGRTTEMLEFFSERFGIEYPWDKYAQVVVEQFIWGGMENTSATTLYARTMHDERAMLDSTPDWLIAHELGHQWWGDLVTCRNWSHLWLNEGFATYCEILWAEHKLGDDERDWRLFEKSQSARSGSAQTRPIVDRTYPHPGSLFDVRAYPKGGWVLHMLRRRLGDEDFFNGLQRYGTVYAYQTAETTDLRRSFERLYGISLERFFYDWTERPGHPELLAETRSLPDQKAVEIRIEQTQKAEPFHIPIKVAVTTGGNDTDGRPNAVTEERLMTDRQLTLRLSVQGTPLGVSIDPALSLLATIREKKSDQFWEWQLQHGLNVAEIARAIDHFGETDSVRSRELLRDALLKPVGGRGTHYGVRSEAAKALGKLKGDAARDALIAGLNENDPHVRRACADALSKFKGDEVTIAALKNKQQQGDTSYPTEAAVISSLSEVLPEPPFELFVAALDKPSHREAIRIAALSELGRTSQRQAFDLLFAWTGHNRPDVCRSQAISSLARYVIHNELGEQDSHRVVDHLLELLGSEGPRHRATIVSALGTLGRRARSATDRLRQIADHDPNDLTRDAASAALVSVQSDNGSAGELARLRHDLESERRRVQELAKRLDAVEQSDAKTP